MKSILITGASSGIGKATAVYFAIKGWHVYATMRTPEKEIDLQNIEGEITILKLDVTNDEQIKDLAKTVLANGGIDVLFNNAGYGMKGPLEAVPEKSIRELFETDVFGTIKLTQAFLPYFKEKKSGMILTTTSLAGMMSFPADSIYNCAKRGLEGLCEALYYELRPYGIRVKTLVPGAVKTNFKMEDFDNGEHDQVNHNLANILIPDFSKFPEPKEAAEVVWNAVNDPTEKFHYIVGDVAGKLLAKRDELGMEEFKEYFYKQLYTN